jgi:hypothetical protein
MGLKWSTQSLAASQPFSWIRAAGLRSIAAALSAGLEDAQALTTVLEATYSQGDPAKHALHIHWASSVRAGLNWKQQLVLYATGLKVCMAGLGSHCTESTLGRHKDRPAGMTFAAPLAAKLVADCS